MKKTLLILGAGSTKDIFWFFPTGFELIKEINYHLITERRHPVKASEGPCLSSLMNELIRALADPSGQFIKKAIPFDYLDTKEARDFFQLTQTLKTELWRVVLDFEAKSPRGKKYSTEFISIDDFLYKHFGSNEKIRNIVQYSISYLLVGCESALKDKIDKCYEDWVDENWINILFDKCKSYTLLDIVTNLKVITFNYERSFEFFAERYLTRHFGGIPKELKSKFFQNNISHVYGKTGNVETYPFGSINNDNTEKMKNLFRNFDLMYFDRKQIEWNENESFDQILFMGFGFDKENMAKLCLDKIYSPCKKGTGLGLSIEKSNEIYNETGIEIDTSITCKEFVTRLKF